MTQSQQVPSQLSGRVCNGLRISSAWTVSCCCITSLALKPAKTVHMAQVSIYVVVHGPTRDTNINADKCCTVIVFRSSSQTRFILLNTVCLLDCVE